MKTMTADLPTIANAVIEHDGWFIAEEHKDRVVLTRATIRDFRHQLTVTDDGAVTLFHQFHDGDDWRPSESQTNLVPILETVWAILDQPASVAGDDAGKGEA